MRVTVLNEIPEDPDLSEAWNNLVLAMDTPEVFLTYQWALAASRGFQQNLSALLVLMYEAEQLIGVAALAVDPKAPRAAFFLTSSTADYCDIVSAPANRQTVLVALLEEIQKRGLSDLVLANVPANSATLKELPGVAGASHFYVASRTAYNCGVVQLGGEEERETLLRDLASRGREKRALKKLSTLGAVKVIHLTEPEQIGTSLESIVSAQISRFLASNRVSPLVGSERRTFLAQLSELLSESGWLKISQLEIDGRPVAWNFGFRFGGSWFWYLPTFQPEFEHVSPGSCLLRLLVEEGAKDASLQWLDLGLGDEPYKDRYVNNTRQTRYVHLSRGLRRHVATVGRQIVSIGATRFPQVAARLRGARDFCQSIVRQRSTGVSAMTREAFRKASRLIASDDEVLVFEFESKFSGEARFELLPLTREHLVEASISYAGDAETLNYLMKCARRLKSPGTSGFLLQDEQGRPVHFLWIDAYDGFRLIDIDHTIEPLSPRGAMIFDGWTPAAQRGRGYFAAAIRQTADHLRGEGRTAWIFSVAGNAASLRGILNGGFVYRFSLIRHCRFTRSIVTRRDTTTAIPLRQLPELAANVLEKTG